MKRKGNSRILFIAAIGTVIIAVIFIIILLNPQKELDVPIAEDETEENDIVEEEEPEAAEWVTYENEEYAFTIEHPEDWIVREFTDEFTPMFNIYKEGTDTSGLPFTHHSEAVSHVSLYPEGIPTEGFFGESVETIVDFRVPVENPRDYVLADNTRFATMANISEGAATNWSPAGFVFAHTRVGNMEIECLRSGEPIASEICDPLMGDAIVRSGIISAEDRSIQVRILESLQFTQ